MNGGPWPPFVDVSRYGGGTVLQIVDFAVWEDGGTVPGTPGQGGAQTNVLTFTSDNAPSDELWLLERLYLDSTSLVVTRMDMYEAPDAALPQARRDWAPVPYKHPLIRGYRPAVLIRGNRPITIAVTGLQPGDSIRFNLTYAIVKELPVGQVTTK